MSVSISFPPFSPLVWFEQFKPEEFSVWDNLLQSITSYSPATTFGTSKNLLEWKRNFKRIKYRKEEQKKQRMKQIKHYCSTIEKKLLMKNQSRISFAKFLSVEPFITLLLPFLLLATV